MAENIGEAQQDRQLNAAILQLIDEQLEVDGLLGLLAGMDDDMPQVEMLDQPWNQEACKNASIRLSYSGSATK